MWLLKTDGSYELEQFASDDDRPPHAILSHVWGPDEEVTMKHLRENLTNAKKMPGFKKITQSCAFALNNGYEWIWIDTCCIDKTSSADLSEAINSMYTWYGEANVCYAFLRDVDDSNQDPSGEASSFRSSLWFTRGWTLQELIAPRSLYFLAQNWECIGTKESLAGLLEGVTSIKRDVLLHKTPLESVSIARRMSWAAGRKTLRVEDRAYSLMGIFNVNMPTIYGEGAKAFIRLQLEIIRQSPDQSIFAWGTIRTYDDFIQKEPFFTARLEEPSEHRSLLASSPEMFSQSANIEPITLYSFVDSFQQRIPMLDYSPTNYGIHIHLPIIAKRGTPNCFALLACRDGPLGIGLLLRRMVTTPRLGTASSPTDRDPRYFVGLHEEEQPLDPRSPNFRVFRLPLLPGDRKALRARLVVTDMYLHSHNAYPQRSRTQGAAGTQRVAQAKPPNACKFLFIFPGFLVTRLQEKGFELDRTKKVPGWTPGEAWTLSGSNLTLTLSTPASHQEAVVIFRGPKEAFALAIGVTAAGIAWADGVVKGIEVRSADREWEGSAHDAAQRIRTKYRDIGSAEDFSLDKWSSRRRTFGDTKKRAIKVSFKPWGAGERRAEATAALTYEFNIELTGEAYASHPSSIGDSTTNLSTTWSRDRTQNMPLTKSHPTTTTTAVQVAGKATPAKPIPNMERAG